jgi:hypothetical protein
MCNRINALSELIDRDPTVDYNLMLKPLHHHLVEICILTLTSHPPLYDWISIHRLKGHACMIAAKY